MTFVLVHGSGGTASCWDDVVPFLGEPAIAIDLPGRGTRPYALDHLNIALFADAVAEEILTCGLEDVVLVGHSLAGITLPAVVERVPERIRHLVFIAAAVPPDGLRVVDMVDPSMRPMVEDYARQPPAPVDPVLAAALFCDGMTEAQTARTLSTMVPEAPGLVLEPVSLSGLQHGVPRSWIRLERDTVNPPAQQDEAIVRLSAATYTLDAGHMALITHPRELAQILMLIAGRE
jgi:pimeloyl-ACP methyl ester carboxylesterase